MIWRLEYCNKDGVQARLDIIRGASTPVEVIEGTATPFILNYKLDKPDKSGFFMTSSADISIFETPTFNIDNLKTSSETEIKVEHYINGVLDWSGFVIPDFFSKTIGTPATVEMVASDRLGTLKGVTLDDLNQYESMRSLAVKCLAKTGLSLPLYTMADFVNNSQSNAFFKALGLAGRLSDTKGRNISCYDILKSILVASNSKLVQQSGAWYIVNKFQHEQGAGNLFSTLTASTAYSEQTVNFSDVHVGARRTIIPVAATTGVFQEFGGGRSYPDNFDFRDGLSGWTTAGTFVATIDNREITGYNFGPIGATIRFGDETEKNYLLNKNVFNVANYIQSADIDVPYDTGRIEVILDINATGPRMAQAIAAANLRVSVGARSGSQTLWLNTSGVFQTGSTIVHNLYFPKGVVGPETANFSVKGVLEQPSGYDVFVRIYGSNEAVLDQRETAVNFAMISFKSTTESPKGLVYRRNQGTGFTKKHDIDTSIFGDYMRKGLDGYFYEYPIDDTSSLYSTAGTLTEPLWTAHGDTEQLPLLRHVTRQKSRMFSLAHNMISARIDVDTFKPLSIFVDCNSVNPRHVVVSASYDFLRSEVEVELEQIAYATLDVREFIYSYFGDGELGISSVGGISGGGTGTGGGGMTAEQIELLNTVAGYWTLDENGNLKTTYNAYSEQELSAYGFGGSGGGGGGLIETVYGYGNLGGTFSNADLNNTFNAYTINQLHLRIETLESGGGSGSVTSVGLSAPTGFTVSGSPVTSSGTLAIAFTAGYSLPTTAKQTAWDNHLTATNNPHGVTASQVGALPLSSARWANFGYSVYALADENLVENGQGLIKLDGWYYTTGVASGSIGTRLTILGQENHDKTQLYFNGNNGSIQYRKSWYINTPWTSLRTILDTSNYVSLITNVSSATKLQTSRTIWGQSFDGSANVSGAMTGVGNINMSGRLYNDITGRIFLLGMDALGTYIEHQGTSASDDKIRFQTKPSGAGGNYSQFFIDPQKGFIFKHFASGRSNVMIGTDVDSGYKLDVSGTGRFTGDLTAPKVIFSAAGWSMVQVGTELQMQYNGVAKMRFLNDGSIVAVGEITAYS